MAKTISTTATKNTYLPVRNNLIKGFALTSGADASTVKFYDGTIDAIATFQIVDGGSAYAVGDLFTLEAGEYGGTKAILRVTQIDDHSASSSISSSVSSSPSTSISLSASTSISSSISSSPSSSASSSLSRSSSISTSPSSSLSVSSSISSSPSTSISSSPSSSISTSVSSSPSSSESPSTSISASPSTSISSSPSTSISSSISNSISTSISNSPSTSISSSPSSSISSSISASPSTSISSSPSSSLSPSVATGIITAAELINAGGGYTANNNYDIESTDGSGTLTVIIKVLTVTDPGTLIASLGAAANVSAAPINYETCVLTTKGVSVRVTGTTPTAYITYE